MPADNEPASYARKVKDKEVLNRESIMLMSRIAEGDAEAFAALVALHQHAVIGTCAKMLGNIDDAHDLAQQVFLRVWKSAPRYKPTARFTTWLFTITRNLVFNQTRSNQRAHFVSIDAEGDNEASQRVLQAATATTPADDALAAELAHAIDQAIQKLPETQRLAVILRRYQDLTYEEIAESMDSSISAVKSLLFRARAQLRESLSGYLEDDC
jgi:RNA polymerase sigma-70 factor (ECF subfamily)